MQKAMWKVDLNSTDVFSDGGEDTYAVQGHRGSCRTGTQ